MAEWTPDTLGKPPMYTYMKPPYSIFSFHMENAGEPMRALNEATFTHE